MALYCLRDKLNGITINIKLAYLQRSMGNKGYERTEFKRTCKRHRFALIVRVSSRPVGLLYIIGKVLDV